MSKDFKEGSLVWAKMKGYPFWPGEIITPPSDLTKSKAKIPQHCVLFFGTNDHAFVPDDNILEHDDNMLEKYGTKKKMPVFRKAVEAIIERTKNISSDESIDVENYDSAASNVEDMTSSFESQSLEMHACSSTETNTEDSSEDSDDIPSGIDKEKVAEYEKMYEEILENQPENIDEELKKMHQERRIARNTWPTEYIRRPVTPPLDLLAQNIFLQNKNIKPTSLKIGFLGLSKLGQGMIKNLCQSGHSVIIYNRTLAKCGPFVKAFHVKVCKTPADLVMAADVIFCCVSDADASKSLFYGDSGVLKGLEKSHGLKTKRTCRKGYVEMTSMDPKDSQDKAEEVQRLGCLYLEAPFIGTRAEANQGKLFLQIAGDQSLYEDCKSCFQAICNQHKYVSAEVGYASKLHLLYSMVQGTAYSNMAETLKLFMVNKVNTDHLDTAFGHETVQHEFFVEKSKFMLDKNYTTKIPMKHVQKDLALGMKLSSSVEQPTPVVAAANEVLKKCLRANYRDHDITAVYEGTNM